MASLRLAAGGSKFNDGDGAEFWQESGDNDMEKWDRSFIKTGDKLMGWT